MRRRLLLAYLLLLVASNVYRLTVPRPPEVADGGRLFTTADGVRVAYDFDEAETPPTVQELLSPEAAPALLLLHGSPGSRHDFDGVRRLLPPDITVVAPDLPGFGDSWTRSGDFGADAHARAVLELLENLELPRVHVLGFSMGGGVALELAQLDPARVSSVQLLGAIGVQELELFGSHTLNHAVHAGQLGLMTATTWLLPHFGRLDRFPLNVAYARNFYDTDQRPYRAWLEATEVPVQVIHGVEDFLVPIEAAREHRRIVPHAELVELDGSHFLPWTHKQEVATLVTDFVRRAAAGEARTRGRATTAELSRAEEPFDPGSVPPFNGPTLLVAMILLALATLVSEDLTCIATGLLVAQGRISLLAGASACFAGIFIGDMLLFLAGRKLGRPAICRAPLKWMVSSGGVERASQWFRRRGPWVIFLSRFMPGLRLPTYFAAGVLKTKVLWFASYFALAGVIWTPTLVWLSSRLGERMEGALDMVQGYGLPGMLLFLLVLGLMWRFLFPLATWRGRRELAGRLRRARAWEYWPRWRLYLPVVPAILGAARRHGGLRMVTAVNPGIEGGGIAGESKGRLLEAMAGEGVARTLRLPAGGGERLPQVQAWREAEGLEWPLVLKPDAGDRGFGVAVLDRAEDALSWLVTHPREALAQEFCPGFEFGASWERDPRDPADQGRLTSLALKEPPTVVGDGTSNLERLILTHPRHVATAPSLLEGNAARLFEVPAEGERVTLGQLGTHSRGAAFLDRQELRSPALEEALRTIAGRVPGFHMGRFDLRVANEEDLQVGRGLKVIELNGVTGEPAHLYDPQHRVGAMRAELKDLWRRAYAIGEHQHAAGAPLPRWGELLGWWRRSR
jgi:pimeloyl-ACP methyl ester carboxylesterase/membrane protein DedA with SNARE-associated domain